MVNDRYSLYKVTNGGNTGNYKTIQIKEWGVGIRKLITPAKRVPLPNPCPSKPHNIWEENIKVPSLILTF